MRIDRVYIDGFRNLKDVEADFNEGCLTTVIIGQNGAGKSNLIEAIVEIFRHLDPPNSKHGGKLRFTFEIDYIIKGRTVRVGNADRPPLTSEAIERRHEAMKDLIKQLTGKVGTAH